MRCRTSSAGPAPYTRFTLHPQPSTLNPQPSAINPQPSTLNPKPSTLNPEPSTLGQVAAMAALCPLSLSSFSVLPPSLAVLCPLSSLSLYLSKYMYMHRWPRWRRSSPRSARASC